jgi:putative phage-type endonuclease
MLKYLEKDLPQGSAAWLELRKGYITATMASVAAGNSPFQNPDKLWKELLGIIPPQSNNHAMARGKRLEPVARAKYQARTGEYYEPLCLISETELDGQGKPWVFASLDGMDAFDSKGVEIKCPGEKTHRLALQGIVPSYYQDQIYWQYLSSENKLQIIDYVSFNPDFPESEQLVIIPVPLDILRQQELISIAKGFRHCVINKIPPCGSEFEAAAKAFVVANMEAEIANKKLEEAKKAVITAAKGQPQNGSGVIVSIADRKGTVDSAKVLEVLMMEFGISEERIAQIMKDNTGPNKSVTSVKAANDAKRVYDDVMANRFKEMSQSIGQVQDAQASKAAVPEVSPIW